MAMRAYAIRTRFSSHAGRSTAAQASPIGSLQRADECSCCPTGAEHRSAHFWPRTNPRARLHRERASDMHEHLNAEHHRRAGTVAWAPRCAPRCASLRTRRMDRCVPVSVRREPVPLASRSGGGASAAGRCGPARKLLESKALVPVTHDASLALARAVRREGPRDLRPPQPGRVEGRGPRRGGALITAPTPGRRPHYGVRPFFLRGSFSLAPSGTLTAVGMVPPPDFANLIFCKDIKCSRRLRQSCGAHARAPGTSRRPEEMVLELRAARRLRA